MLSRNPQAPIGMILTSCRKYALSLKDALQPNCDPLEDTVQQRELDVADRVYVIEA